MRKAKILISSTLLILFIGCSASQNYKHTTKNVFFDKNHIWSNKKDHSPIRSITMRIVNKNKGPVEVKTICYFKEDPSMQFGEKTLNIEGNAHKTFMVMGMGHSNFKSVSCMLK